MCASVLVRSFFWDKRTMFTIGGGGRWGYEEGWRKEISTATNSATPSFFFEEQNGRKRKSSEVAQLLFHDKYHNNLESFSSSWIKGVYWCITSNRGGGYDVWVTRTGLAHLCWEGKEMLYKKQDIPRRGYLFWTWRGGPCRSSSSGNEDRSRVASECIFVVGPRQRCAVWVVSC